MGLAVLTPGAGLLAIALELRRTGYHEGSSKSSISGRSAFLTDVGRFHWTVFDVRSLLPRDWREQIIAVAQALSRRRVLVTSHSTSREARADYQLATRVVDGDAVATRLPWLRRLYEEEFKSFAQAMTTEPVSLMCDRRFAMVISIHSGPDRYECHVDTNPIEALLYVTTHRDGDGGELVVSNCGEVRSIEEVDADATVIEPKAGYLVFFDGRNHSHYVAPLKDPTAERIVIAMNYYVPSWPESMRPADLNRHLSGLD